MHQECPADNRARSCVAFAESHDMQEALKYLASLALLGSMVFPACSSDPGDPAGEAGGAGGGGSSPQAGSRNQGGTTPSGGSRNGGTAGETGEGGDAGSPSAGRNMGGTGGTGGDAGAPHGGADGGDDVLATCFDAPVMPDTETQRLRLTGEGIELAIVRYVSLGVVKNLPFTLQRFGYVRGEAAACISDPPRLDYILSHHNWDDEITATEGNDTWVVRGCAAWSIERKTGDAIAWGPVPLTVASCTRVDAPDLACSAIQ